MNVASTSAAGSAATQPSATTVGFGDLKGEDFFALMIAQLQSQDPLKPQDNQQLLSQISSIREIEQSTRLADTLDAQMKAIGTQTKILQNLSSQKFSDPASLIGLYIQGPGVTADGVPVIGSNGKQVSVEGLVIGLEYGSDGKALLKLHTGETVVADTVAKVKIVVPDDGTTDGTTDGTADGSTEGPVGQNPEPQSTAAARLRPGIALSTVAKAGPTATAPGDAIATLLDSLFSQGGGVQFGL